MGKFVWETGRNEVTPDAEIELLMEQKKKGEKEEMSYSYIV